MKKILFTLALLTTSAFADAPFGLKVGMSLADVIKVSGQPEKLGDNFYSFKKVPIPYAGFADYLMVITPQNGLCKVIGFGKPIATSAYGDAIRDEFSSTKESLISKYGKPEGDFNFLRSGSIWKDSNEWTMSLLKEERILAVAWGPLETNGVKNIMLKAKAKNLNSGYITLAYELSNSDACYSEKTIKDSRGL